MLKAGWGRAGRGAADGRSVAQTAAASNQRRHEPPMVKQRPGQAAPPRRRRPAPPAPCRRYSRVTPPTAGDGCGWRGAPGRRTECA